MLVDNNVIPLDGEWRFALDREDRGVADAWFKSVLPDETITLPGSMTENGKGDDVTLETPWTGRIRDTNFFDEERYAPYRQPGNIKLPFWLTPLKHYLGVAWYQRNVDIPVKWTGNTIQLRLERPHWTTKVWVDDMEVGFGEALSTPHLHILGHLVPGTHRLTIRVDNRMYVNVGEDAHSITDHTQTNWNGIVGEISLVAKGDAWFDDLQIYPAADNKSLSVKAHIKDGETAAKKGRVQLVVSDADGRGIGSAVADWAGGDATFQIIVPIYGDVVSWDEFHPELYSLKAELFINGNVADARVDRFGFRHFETRGTKFYLNDRHLFLRGTHEGCTFPKTGYPPTNKSEWLRIFRIIKSHGLNHMRFHSWCPPKSAFEAADEIGIILQVECASWTTVGFDERYDAWLFHEADRILKEYGNHPSFCMMAYGNEPYGFRSSTFLADFVKHYRAKDQRRLFTSGTAWPLIAENDYQVWANPRIQYWDQNLDSRINAKPPESTTDYSSYIAQYPQPVISHEIGQWCVYPNFDEISKYDGCLRAYNFEVFCDFLNASGMGDQAVDFLMASGMLQVLCYKEEVESALRTPGMGGFHLLDLHDYSGQGTALVGVLDAFWDPKPYITAEEFKKFAGPVVPLACLEKRIFTSGEEISVELLVSHFGDNELPAGDVRWTLSGEMADESRSDYAGSLKSEVLRPGDLYCVGQFSQKLEDETIARKLVLEVELPGEGSSRNDWDIWVYPASLDITVPDEVLVTGILDEIARERLRSGGKVLLMPDVYRVIGDERGQVPPGFSSIFWNTAWTQGQKPHTLGILCDPSHPALAHFPTEYHSNWQWWYIIQRSRSMIMNPLPQAIKPIIQVIDDWFTARRLGLLMECEMDGGKLLVSSIDLKDGAPDDPVCRQMYYSLLQYAKSDDFTPGVKLSVGDLQQVLQMKVVN